VNTTAANIATLVTSEQAQSAGGQPFLRLAEGSTGVRSISSVTFSSASGGLVALVLVNPLVDLRGSREVNTMAEKCFPDLHPGAPRIYDGAYLNLISNCAATLAAGTLAGYAKFAWGE